MFPTIFTLTLERSTAAPPYSAALRRSSAARRCRQLYGYIADTAGRSARVVPALAYAVIIVRDRRHRSRVLGVEPQEAPAAVH